MRDKIILICLLFTFSFSSVSYSCPSQSYQGLYDLFSSYGSLGVTTTFNNVQFGPEFSWTFADVKSKGRLFPWISIHSEMLFHKESESIIFALGPQVGFGFLGVGASPIVNTEGKLGYRLKAMLSFLVPALYINYSKLEKKRILNLGFR